VDDLVKRYSGQGGGTAPAPENPQEDFRQASRAAPQNVVANGISQALRSDRTPPFSQMLANLFSHSDPNQRAGVLNRLLGSVDSGALNAVPGLSGLSSMLGIRTVSPEEANAVSPDQVQQIAAHAQEQNPSIVDEVSGFYAQHPQVVKAVGGLALSIALQHMLRR